MKILSIAIVFLVIGGMLTSVIGSISGHMIPAIVGIVMMAIAIVAVPMRFLFKPIACLIGWHSYRYEFIEQAGANTHARCKWCGYEGIIDSQGNLF